MHSFIKAFDIRRGFREYRKKFSKPVKTDPGAYNVSLF